MDCDDGNNSGAKDNSIDDVSRSAVNSLILDYYKKFGRKRDLEQYFSLSTAQSDIRDPSSIFWRRMKAQNDSSDSGEKKSESSTELCRISIKCSIPEPTSSQDENTKTKSDSESPPIITEDIKPVYSGQSDDDLNSDDNQSQKSADAILDTSMNKPLSPTSSITSQRKLEWDSLADVGYANESDRKTSASSLSTLERLALKQQYTYNDTKQASDLGPPTAHSTPVEVTDQKPKPKKGIGKKTTKIYKRDVDFVEFQSDNPSQAINVNLTKHISFNVERDGGVKVENDKQDINVTPEKVSVETEITPQVKMDKEIQTSLLKQVKVANNDQNSIPKGAVLINFNTLRRKQRRKRVRMTKRKIKLKKNESNKENLPVLDKSGEPVSDAGSFEYMPGHIYNQNQMQQKPKSVATVGNKSSLESSGVLTTDSSKESKNSLTKDLEKSLDMLKIALQKHNDTVSKKILIEEIVKRLLKSRYRDDESTTDILSGLSFSSKKLGLGDGTTSTSDANNTGERVKVLKPKKSILRVDKFNPNALASTSQSVPNLPVMANIDKPIHSHLNKTMLTSSNTESDVSSKDRRTESSSDNAFAKTSSEELYQKYLDALKREQAYKKHLRDKELFLRQKLSNSDVALKMPVQIDQKAQGRLKDLIKDLTRNNYDDGSGDASKLEGGYNINSRHRGDATRSHRSHSVFTLSSGNSDGGNRQPYSKNTQKASNDSKAGTSKELRCCGQWSSKPKVGLTDSSIQVNINELSQIGPESNQNEYKASQCSKSNKTSPRNITHVVSDNATGDIKFVCVCPGTLKEKQDSPEDLLIYKCSKLTNKCVHLDDLPSRISDSIQCEKDCKTYSSSSKSNTSESSSGRQRSLETGSHITKISSKSSQTEMGLKKPLKPDTTKKVNNLDRQNDKAILVHETTRWIQTEISIDPKISDPSLTDVNLINSKDCVKIISEQYKKVKKSSSDSAVSSQNKNTDVEVVDEVIANAQTKCSDKEMQFNSEEQVYVNKPSTSYIDTNRPSNSIPTDYKIPIKGTNMTLMVSLGADVAPPFKDKRSIKASQGVGTDQVQFDEKGTSLTEECSKGVQCRNNDIFAQIDDHYSKETDGKNLQEQQKINDNFTKTCPLTNTNYNIPKSYNTYPKNTPVNEHKPFLRSNTDTSRLDKACFIQTGYKKLKDAESQHDFVNAQSQRTVGTGTDRSSPRMPNRSCCKELQCSNNDGGEKIFNRDDIMVRNYQLRSDYRGDKSKQMVTTDGETCTQSNTESEEARKTESVATSHKDYKTGTTQSTDSDKSTASTNMKSQKQCCNVQSSSTERSSKTLNSEQREKPTNDRNSTTKSSETAESSTSKDPILDMIQDITRKYSKKDIEKSKRKKCFKEIMTVLTYLLDTDESVEPDGVTLKESSVTKETDSVPSDSIKTKNKDVPCGTCISTPETKKLVDKGVQLSKKKSKRFSNTDSSDFPGSTELPSTSTDSATCKVLNRIKKECEKYYQKKSKSSTKKFEASSSTSMNCEQCNRIHHYCRGHKCKGHKSKPEKTKKCVAYNLIIQTSDSMMNEEPPNNPNPLRNIVIKVPSKRKELEKMPFKEVSAKIEQRIPYSPRCDKTHRSRSLPSEMSSTDEVRGPQHITIKQYLERNRPDFVDQSAQRQNCLKLISEKRANERAAQRKLLSMQVAGQASLNALSETELRLLAKELGIDSRRKKVASKFISERDMKKHSELIYKSLPEVVQKKDEIKKENMKKTNLLMASIFKKNLQKKTLQGAVNLSNYSTVIKI